MRRLIFLLIGGLVISCTQFNLSHEDGGLSVATDGAGQGPDVTSPVSPPNVAGAAVDAPVVEFDGGGRAIDPACPTVFHQCPLVGCVDSRSPDHCGASCSPCPSVLG